MQLVQGLASRSFFREGGAAEHFIAVAAPAGLDLAGQIAEIGQRYAEARDALGLSPGSAVFQRLFVSDVMNQAGIVRESSLFDDSAASPVAVSLVQQPPLPGAKLALLAYHVAGGAEMCKRRLGPRHVLVERDGRREIWTTGLCVGDRGAGAPAALQTRQVFAELADMLAGEGGSLRDHCLRTWVYLKDVDVFYQGMVEARGRVFAEHGLSERTHYVASTGIEGAGPHRHDLVTMDAYSSLDLVPGQVAYLNDFDHLCPTRDYGVHFERGTRVAYADRVHCFISGTASIDCEGHVVHPGSVLAQLDRAVENVEALLHSGGAGLGDLMHLIVYLRDPADFAQVDGRLAERVPGLPLTVVQAAVCRPEWLVEIEGIAITDNDAPDLPAF